MRRQDWTLAGVMGSVHFAFHLFIRVVPPLIPVLAVQLGLPFWKLGLLVGVYFGASSVGLLPAGVLSDAVDRRLTLTGGIGLVSVGYLLFAYAPVAGDAVPTVTLGPYAVTGTFLWMLFAMLVAGLGSSVHIPVGVPLITENVDDANKGMLLGVWGSSSKLGDAATPALVGLLVLTLSWDRIVVLFGALGLVYTVALFVVLGRPQFETAPPLRDAGADGDTDAGVDAGATSADSVWRSDRRTYLYPIAVLVLYFAGYQVTVQGVVTFTPVFITDVYGYGLTLAGVSFAEESFADFALSTLLLAGAAGRLGAGAVVDRYDHRSVLLATLAVAALALLVFTFVTLGPISILAVLAIFGAALYGNSPARDTLISDLSPAHREGRTFSYLWTASRVFSAVSPVLVGLSADTVGIQQGFGFLTGAVVVSAVAVALLFSERVYVDTSRRNARS